VRTAVITGYSPPSVAALSLLKTSPRTRSNPPYLIYHCQQRSYNLLLVIEALAESEAYHDEINRTFTALATLLRPVCEDLNEIMERWDEEVQP
jgi:hypothetical protein